MVEAEKNSQQAHRQSQTLRAIIFLAALVLAFPVGAIAIRIIGSPKAFMIGPVAVAPLSLLALKAFGMSNGPRA